ncbi:MAG: FAD/NAD(P)-binding protein [Gemmatimonadota bacterium]
MGSPASTLSPRAMVPEPWRVLSAHQEAPGVVTLEMEPLSGEPPRFRPGQFSMLYAFGVGEIPISVSGDCTDPSKVVHTIRDVGAVSAALTGLEEGATVGLRGPFGTAWPVDTAGGRDVLVVGGGLGMVPLRPVLYELARGRADYRHVSVVYGTRTPADIVFGDQLAAWRDDEDFSLGVTVDMAESDWKGHVGTVVPLIERADFDPATTTAFVCGPEVMMRIVSADLVRKGVPARHVHLSMERNMKCAIGLCGHCQWGSDFVCKDGPVYDWERVAPRLSLREL